jgi:hypothetical protein
VNPTAAAKATRKALDIVPLLRETRYKAERTPANPNTKFIIASA